MNSAVEQPYFASLQVFINGSLLASLASLNHNDYGPVHPLRCHVRGPALKVISGTRMMSKEVHSVPPTLAKVMEEVKPRPR